MKNLSVSALSARLLAVLLTAVLIAACSPKKVAINAVGNALSGGGSVFESDEDPDLIREALPFGLKTYESLLAEVPEHEGLLLATAKGFSAYAYLLLQDADRIDERDYLEARFIRRRARGLFLRGRDYGFRGLELRHPGFESRLMRDRDAALSEIEEEDLGFLYWAAAGWAGALSAAKNDTDLIAALPISGAMVEHLLRLDESYDQGTAHEFLIAYEGARPGGDMEKARRHYARALDLSGGTRAGLHVSLAETAALQAQDVAEFRRLLNAALAVDLDAEPGQRLVNTLAQRRAEWLLSRMPDLFFDLGDAE